MKRGDIVLIKFPFTDLSTTKVRPALVVSADNTGEDAIFVPLSSNITNPTPFDILVDSADPEFAATGLRAPALIKVKKTVILLKDLAIRKLGEAGPNTMSKVNTLLASVLGLTLSSPVQLTPQASSAVSNGSSPTDEASTQ